MLQSRSWINSTTHIKKQVIIKKEVSDYPQIYLVASYPAAYSSTVSEELVPLSKQKTKDQNVGKKLEEVEMEIELILPLQMIDRE
jgi:hypothetical protein